MSERLALYDVIDQNTGVHLAEALPRNWAERQCEVLIADGWTEAIIIDAYGHYGSLSPDKPAEGWSREHGTPKRPSQGEVSPSEEAYQAMKEHAPELEGSDNG